MSACQFIRLNLGILLIFLYFLSTGWCYFTPSCSLTRLPVLSALSTGSISTPGSLWRLWWRSVQERCYSSSWCLFGSLPVGCYGNVKGRMIWISAKFDSISPFTALKFASSSQRSRIKEVRNWHSMISILYYIIKVSWWGVRQYSEQFVAGGHYLFMCRLWRYCAQYLPWQKHLPLLWSHGKIQNSGQYFDLYSQSAKLQQSSLFSIIDYSSIISLSYIVSVVKYTSMLILYLLNQIITLLVTWPEYSWAALE